MAPRARGRAAAPAAAAAAAVGGADSNPAPSKRRRLADRTPFEHPLDTPSVHHGKGQVLSLGMGEMGQLGLGPDCCARTNPFVVPLLREFDAVAVAAGGMHSLVLLRDGTVQSWGVDDHGVLGRPKTGEDYEWVPGRVEGLEGVRIVQVDGGASHSIALSEEGTVYTWGQYRHQEGELGYSASENDRALPGEVEGPWNDRIVHIAAGENHDLALSESGKIYQWGDARFGQRVPRRHAKGKLAPRWVPLCGSMRRLKPCKVFAGANHSIAVTTDHQIVVWGNNNYGQCGVGVDPDSEDPLSKFVLTPALVPFFAGAKQGEIDSVAAGEHHTLVLMRDGRVFAMGRNAYGQLGIGSKDQDAHWQPTLVPAFTGADDPVVRVAAGSVVSYAVTQSGKLFGWGFGESYCVGNAKDADALSPSWARGKKLTGKPGEPARAVVAVAGGAQHALMVAIPVGDAASPQSG